ncbi:hypothetical protein UY3_06340 [Chelonia mydas]|uniref:Uncharacterized protein n=1 Tax=Chelonia mydas TaxID=8469 RepID=M7BL68_CHEMY|nr:hypothetical protein UY3_06340 [Chelonia mydas]
MSQLLSGAAQGYKQSVKTWAVLKASFDPVHHNCCEELLLSRALESQLVFSAPMLFLMIIMDIGGQGWVALSGGISELLLPFMKEMALPQCKGILMITPVYPRAEFDPKKGVYAGICLPKMPCTWLLTSSCKELHCSYGFRLSCKVLIMNGEEIPQPDHQAQIPKIIPTYTWPRSETGVHQHSSIEVKGTAPIYTN